MSVAIAHDYLNQRGGAERVVVELARIFPGAPVYTSLYRADSTFPEFARLDVRTSPIDRLPVDTRFRTLLPLYPAAFRALSPLHEDIVVSSSSGWAHGIRTDPDSIHVVYCHTPARWLYETEAYLPGGPKRALTAPLRGALRRWDRNAAHRADLYLANSEHVSRRIRAAYGIEARVLHPPVRTDGLRPTTRGDRLLVISRLLPYKRVDLIVDAASEAGLGLDVVGTGPSLDELRARAGSSVTFHGRVEEDSLRELLLGCRALCFPGSEDFGIVPVEANAAGKPVIGFAEGGVLETQVEGRTATFFGEPTPAAALDAIRRADALETSPEQIARNAERFSPAVFKSGMLAAVEEAKRSKAEGRKSYVGSAAAAA
jgi:glycosyltransferase involved in cell wall biosynthesis